MKHGSKRNDQKGKMTSERNRLATIAWLLEFCRRLVLSRGDYQGSNEQIRRMELAACKKHFPGFRDEEYHILSKARNGVSHTRINPGLTKANVILEKYLQ